MIPTVYVIMYISRYTYNIAMTDQYLLLILTRHVEGLHKKELHLTPHLKYHPPLLYLAIVVEDEGEERLRWIFIIEAEAR